MTIVWPEAHRPGRVAVEVSNEIEIAAPPDRVWRWLIAARAWPHWYPNSSDVRLEGGARELAAGVAFRWRTFGVEVSSVVREFVLHERIAWDGRAFGLDVYHAWLIEPHPGGCRVLTQENQNGLLARLGALIMPRRMSEGHDLWLRNLRRQAEGGEPV